MPGIILARHRWSHLLLDLDLSVTEVVLEDEGALATGPAFWE